MAVGADAEQDQVEHRQLLAIEKPAQLFFVSVRSLLWRQFPLDAVDVRSGEGDLGKKDIIGGAVVAVGVFRWHAALVGPEDMQLFPVEPAAKLFTGEEPVEW